MYGCVWREVLPLQLRMRQRTASSPIDESHDAITGGDLGLLTCFPSVLGEGPLPNVEGDQRPREDLSSPQNSPWS